MIQLAFASPFLSASPPIASQGWLDSEKLHLSSRVRPTHLSLMGGGPLTGPSAGRGLPNEFLQSQLLNYNSEEEHNDPLRLLCFQSAFLRSSWQPEAGRARIILPILQMRKWRFREGMWLFQGHTDNEQQSQRWVHYSGRLFFFLLISKSASASFCIGGLPSTFLFKSLASTFPFPAGASYLWRLPTLPISTEARRTTPLEKAH